MAIENTKLLADTLRAVGVEVEYDLLAGMGHGDTGETPVFERKENVARDVAFLDAHVPAFALDRTKERTR